MTGVIIQVYGSEQAMHAPHAYTCSNMLACTCIRRCTCLQRHRPAAEVAPCTDVRAHAAAPCFRPYLTAAGQSFKHLRRRPAHTACEWRSTMNCAYQAHQFIRRSLKTVTPHYSKWLLGAGEGLNLFSENYHQPRWEGAERPHPWAFGQCLCPVQLQNQWGLFMSQLAFHWVPIWPLG